MVQTLAHIAEGAAWVFVIIFAFALIGIYATVRWIVDLVTGAERAVEGEVRTVEERLK
jgi:hypothetical protein